MTTNQTSKAGEMTPCPTCGARQETSLLKREGNRIRCMGCDTSALAKFWNDRATESHLRAQLAEAEKERDQLKEQAAKFLQGALIEGAKILREQIEKERRESPGKSMTEIMQMRLDSANNATAHCRETMAANLTEVIAERDAAQARVGEMEGLLRRCQPHIRYDKSCQCSGCDGLRQLNLSIDAALATSPRRTGATP